MSDARARLAARQADVLDALLAGQVPTGFDPRTTRAAGALLRNKRRYEAVRARPELRSLPDWRNRFDAWARQNPRQGCACSDAHAFVASVDDDGLPEPLRSWWRTQQVYDGLRRLALVRRHGRRELLMGWGERVLHLAVRPARETEEA